MVTKAEAMRVPAYHGERMARARLSLDGLSVGDAFGECFFGPDGNGMASGRRKPEGNWCVTDDTVMALSVSEVLERHGRVVPDVLAKLFADRYMRDPHRDLRSYGGAAHHILMAISKGIPWQTAAGMAFNGQGSMGNGGAMRVGPVGAYFADDLEAVVENARASAQVTHAHPDGQAGAIAAAVATAMAYRTRDLEARQAGREMLTAAVGLTPEGATRQGLVKAAALAPGTEAWTAASMLGNGARVISSDTVPFTLWCAASHIESYTESLWQTVTGMGDIDTNCAIVGSIVVMRAGQAGIPADWLKARESLDI